MHKIILSLLTFILGTTTLTQAQSFQWDKISSPLQMDIQESPDAYHSIYILLADRVNAAEMDYRLTERKATLQERTLELITALQEKAQATQGQILEILTHDPGVKPESIYPLWITNVIFLEAKATVIARLSNRNEVAWIEENWEAELTGEIETAGPVTAFIPNGLESGLEAINAPAMWKLGYTGYGRKAMIMDTGEDDDHPAIRNQYAGHCLPTEQAWSGSGTPSPCLSSSFSTAGHGTHCTGTIVGLDRLARDTIGVAYNGQWMGGGVNLQGCHGFEDGSALGISKTFQWALDPDGKPTTIDDMPDVINNSWGRSEPSVNNCTNNNNLSLQMADALYAAGIAVVFSAGNSGPEAQTVGAPAIMNSDLIKIFAVGALDGSQNNYPIGDFSSRGPTICPATPGSSLEIKPEVSAPGVQVRSSVPGGGYQSWNGTSMAAPHVSGAILLLKEAFPYLTGAELKLALYFSCKDLGQPGEDNIYGMGLIDVFAAYQYLIDEGHAPVPPVSTAREIILLDIGTRQTFCGQPFEAEVSFVNEGTETLHSLIVDYSIETPGVADGSLTWEGNLLPGETGYAIINGDVLTEGKYELTVNLHSPNGNEDERYLNNKLKIELEAFDMPEITASAETTFGTSVCKGTQVLLKANSERSGISTWHTSINSVLPEFEGSPVLTPPLFGDQVFFLDFVSQIEVGEEKILDDDLQPGETGGLIFDCHHSFTLKTVKVYSEKVGLRIVKLMVGNLELDKRTLIVKDIGENVLKLNMKVPALKNLRLELEGLTPLMYNGFGANYPYELKDIVTIKRSTDPFFPQDAYSYFYDWEVEYSDLCGWVPVEIQVDVNGLAPVVSFSSSDTIVEDGEFNTLAFSDLSNTATIWHWDFGDGNTSKNQNPIHTFSQPGLYPVILTVWNAEGCKNTAMLEIEIEEGAITNTYTPDLENKILVFPNPTSDKLNVQFQWPESREVAIELVDVMGRKVLGKYLEIGSGQTVSFSTKKLPIGVYFLTFKMNKEMAIKKIMVSK